MNQLVVKSFGSVDAVRKYSGALRAATRGISAGNDRDILKIDDRNGDWTFGQDNTYVERDDLWAVNPLTIKHGYIAFDGGRDIAETKDGDRAEMLFSVTQELPEFDDLPELDIRSKKGRDETKWKFQMAVEMVCVEGPNKGAEVVYKPGSQGGLRAVRMIAEEIARRFDDEDADTHVPVVELDSRSYHNKRYNKEVFNPLMHVIEWAGLDDTKFESGSANEDRRGGAREDDTKSRKSDRDERPARGGKKDEPRGNGRGRDGDDDPDRRSAREARKDERTARGDKVDSRRSSRDEEAVEDEPKARRRGRDEEDGGEDADGRDEPRSTRRATHDDGKTARRGPAPRDREERAAKVEEEPRRRGGRDRDEEVAETETSSRRDETSSRGRRGARDRDEDQDDREDAKADDAPRSRRGRDDEDEPRAGPRGRRAAAGGRR